MASTLAKFFLFVVALVLGIGITMFGSSLVPWIDFQTKVILAIVLTLFAFMSLHFMTKGSGG
ncbi:MAG: hypothetical protein ACP5N9_03445 [Candidatus Bilamarchaeum sp.]|jgi:hypothetical protein